MKYKAYAGVSLGLLVLLGLLFLSSCVTVQEGGVAPPPPPLRSMPAEGRPAFHRGLPASYWVWHDREGWHLRVTTAAGRHQFRGVIEASGGFIEGFHATRLEWRDRVVEEGRRMIRFDFWAHGDIDGFDWRSTTGCNIFELYIDGMPRPEFVFVGAFGNNPPATSFEACP